MKLRIPTCKIPAISVPISIARESIIDSSHVCTLIRETPQKIEFSMKADDGTSFTTRIANNLREECVVVEMQYQEKFENGERFVVFSRRVDRCIEKVLEHEEGALSGYVVPAFYKDIAVLQYVVPLQYGFLSDQEYVDQLGIALVQCSKAMALMCTIVNDLFAAGRLLSDKECMRSVYRGYGYLVPSVSAEQAAGRPN